MAGVPWDASYHDGAPPWDIGHPQPAIQRLSSRARFESPVLDAGCGTGEHALHLASQGCTVVGVDVAETALTIAREKAIKRGLEVEFALADALHLERLGETFRTVLDCGLFHTFDAQERTQYALSLASVTRHDGKLYVLCFSDEGAGQGPHPISRDDLQAAFSTNNGWEVVAIDPEHIHTRDRDMRVPAWLGEIKRTRR